MKKKTKKALTYWKKHIKAMIILFNSLIYHSTGEKIHLYMEIVAVTTTH